MLVTLTVCTIEYRCGEILRFYKKKLENLYGEEDLSNVLDFALFYFKIIKILKKLRETLSTLLFLLLLCNCMATFTGLYLIVSYSQLMENEFEEWEFVLLIQVLFITISGACMIFAQAVFGSLIPENLREIRDTAANLIEIHGKELDSRSKIYFYLKRIERKDIVHLTACDMINVQRHLLLSCFGALLTYGLLLINMKN